GLGGSGALCMNTSRKSAKAGTAPREPRVAWVVTTPDEDPRPRAVVIRGRAELVEAPEATPGRARAPVTDEVVDRVRARLAEGKRVVVCVVPDDVRLVGAHR